MHSESGTSPSDCPRLFDAKKYVFFGAMPDASHADHAPGQACCRFDVRVNDAELTYVLSTKLEPADRMNFFDRIQFRSIQKKMRGLTNLANAPRGLAAGSAV